MKKLLTILAGLSLLALTGRAEKIDLGTGKALFLTVPASWIVADMPAPPPGMSATGTNVRYVTRNGSNDTVLISVISVPDDRFADRENLKAMAEESTQQFVTGSVEGKANLKELRLATATGLSVTLTDASLVGKPSAKDEYKVLTSCFVYLGGHLMLNATIFTDDLTGKAYADALRLLKSISLEQPKKPL